MADGSPDFRQTAREIFMAALQSVDAGEAVRRAVQFADNSSRRVLQIADSEFDLREYTGVYTIALGKAARAMAEALTAALGDKLSGGVLSAPEAGGVLPDQWKVFAGGHPLPNEASLGAARAAVNLLKRADATSSLIIFLVSGGGSAMMELPRDPNVTLNDLREANRALVNCGATIAEINIVRRSLSAIKGGGLSRVAPRAAQATLVVSDVNKGDEASVASGPSLPVSPPGVDEMDTAMNHVSIVARHNLRKALPPSVRRALEEQEMKRLSTSVSRKESTATQPRHCYVLLDNDHAIARAATKARACGFVVEIAADLIEQPIIEGCRELVSRLLALRGRTARNRPVCLISGGEFACAVRGAGIGGRNAEAALRCAIELDALRKASLRGAANYVAENWDNIVALHAGTDGIDGNSPAAGAVAYATTLARAQSIGLDAHDALARSDAYSFFHALGDAIEIGRTGTNVRDLRILLA